MNNFKPFQISALNSIILIVLGGFGYLQSDTPSPTALIPVFTGVILLVLNKGIKNENKVVAHIAVLLTFIMIPGLLMPLKGAITRSDTYAILRVIIMMGSTIIAFLVFIKSFIDARKARNQA